MSLRTKRRMVAAGYHLMVFAIIFLGIAIGDSLGRPEVAQGFALAFLIHILTFKLIPIYRLLQQRLIPTSECPACGYEVNLVQHWKCSCGFVPPYPRHVFSKCQNCKRNFAWMSCLRCGASILI